MVHALGFYAFFPGGGDRAALYAAIDAALREHLDLTLTDAVDGPWPRRTYGQPAITLHFDFSREPAWAQVMAHPIARDTWNAHRGDHLRRLFHQIVDALPVTMGRTFREGGFMMPREAELAGDLDALDWGQFFDASIARRLESQAVDLAQSPQWSVGPRDGRWLWLDLDPWTDDEFDEKGVDLRESWAVRLGITLRAWPPALQELRADKKRVAESLAPDAPVWDAEACRRAMALRLTSSEHAAAIAPYATVEAALLANDVPEPIGSALLDATPYLELGLLELAIGVITTSTDTPLAMLQARVQAAIAARHWSAVLEAATGPLKAIAVLGGTLTAQTVKSDDDLVRLEAFVRTYAPATADRRALEQLAHWQRFYGRDPDAIHIVLRVLASKPAVPLPSLVHLDANGLEGLLKIAAWGRIHFDEPEVREIVMETLMSDDPRTVLHFAREATRPTVIGGILALQRVHITDCPQPACARRRERLASIDHPTRRTS